MIWPTKTLALNLSLLSILSACSAASDTKPLPATASFSSTALYARFASIAASQRQSGLDAIAQLPILSYVDLLASRMTNNPVAIDDQTYADAQANLAADRSFYKGLARHFDSVGELWETTGLDPRNWALTQYQAALSGAEMPPRLGLADSPAGNYYHRYMATSQPGDACDNYKKRLAEIGVDADNIVSDYNASPGDDPHDENETVLRWSINGTSDQLWMMHRPSYFRPNTNATLLYVRVGKTGVAYQTDDDYFFNNCTTIHPDGTPMQQIPQGEAPPFHADDPMNPVCAPFCPSVGSVPTAALL